MVSRGVTIQINVSKIYSFYKVNTYIGILLIVFSGAQKMRPQASLDFIATREQIVLQRDKKVADDLVLYKDHISEGMFSQATAILGKTIIEDTKIYFIPMVSFGRGQQYTLAYGGQIEYFTINIPEAYQYLTVQAVYPSIKLLPANLLKWYIQFSSPINVTSIYNHIQVTDATGNIINRVILPLENALISNDGCLLTVWIEPGRQKRGLGPNKQLGPVFEKGKKYALVIKKQLKDAEGVTMQEDFTYDFEITEADRTQPDVNLWKVVPPEANTTSNLNIECLESLDYGSALHSITVINMAKKNIEGSWRLADHETRLVFTPLQPWQRGDYQIIVHSRLEDLAGNNLNRLFDREIVDTTIDHPSKKHTLEFSIQ